MKISLIEKFKSQIIKPEEKTESYQSHKSELARVSAVLNRGSHRVNYRLTNYWH